LKISRRRQVLFGKESSFLSDFQSGTSALDITRHGTAKPPDRVKNFSFQGSGGGYSKLFEDTTKVFSWDNFDWFNRSLVVS
jgi:hypothetical protein